MLSRLASYLLGGAGAEDEAETGPGLPAAPALDEPASHTLQTDESPASQEQRQQQLRLRQTEVEGDDWILIDQNVEGCTGMEESWYVTPPACFTRPGPVHVETSPLENLLIEHPSMSVYRDAASSALLETSAGSSASATNRLAEEMLLQETDSSGYGVLTWTTGKPPAGPGSSSRQQADCWSGHPAKPRQPPSLRRQVEEDEEEQEGKELLEDKQQEEAAATGLLLATKAGCSPSRRMQLSKAKCPASSRLVQISKPDCPPSRLSKPGQAREPEKRRMSGAGPQSQLYHHHHHHHHHQSSSGKLTRRQHIVGHVLRPRDGNVPANAGALAVQQPSKEQRPGSGSGLDNQENSRQRHRQQQQMAEQQRHRRPSHGVRELRAGPLEEELRVAQIRSAQQVLQKRTSQASKRNRLERANKAREVASGKGRNPRRQDRMRSNNSYVNNNRKC